MLVAHHLWDVHQLVTQAKMKMPRRDLIPCTRSGPLRREVRIVAYQKLFHVPKPGGDEPIFVSLGLTADGLPCRKDNLGRDLGEEISAHTTKEFW